MPKSARPDLSYFSLEVDGHLYGGWYRVHQNVLEVFARGRIITQPLEGRSAELEARSVLEQLVRSPSKS